jgi:hypothetical protein
MLIQNENSEWITKTGGDGGIRTRDTLLEYAHLANECLQPLGHVSARGPDRRKSFGPQELNAIQSHYNFALIKCGRILLDAFKLVWQLIFPWRIGAGTRNCNCSRANCQREGRRGIVSAQRFKRIFSEFFTLM